MGIRQNVIIVNLKHRQSPQIIIFTPSHRLVIAHEKIVCQLNSITKLDANMVISHLCKLIIQDATLLNNGKLRIL